MFRAFLKSSLMLVFASAMALAPAAHASTTEALNDEYQRIRSEAIRIAGAPLDMPRRVALLHSIYADSGGRYRFPEVALHGASWAYRFFGTLGPVARSIGVRYFYDAQEKERRMKMLNEFMVSFETTNRSVFIDTYSNYYFMKKHWRNDDAVKVVPEPLFSALKIVHKANEEHAALDEKTLRKVFIASLMVEQERTVGPSVAAAVAKFNCPVLRTLSLKPVVRFGYFPKTTYFFFSNFSSVAERVKYAIASYDLAAQAGWKNVFESIRSYEILPEAFFQNADAYAESLR